MFVKYILCIRYILFWPIQFEEMAADIFGRLFYLYTTLFNMYMTDWRIATLVLVAQIENLDWKEFGLGH